MNREILQVFVKHIKMKSESIKSSSTIFVEELFSINEFFNLTKVKHNEI